MSSSPQQPVRLSRILLTVLSIALIILGVLVGLRYVKPAIKLAEHVLPTTKTQTTLQEPTVIEDTLDLIPHLLQALVLIQTDTATNFVIKKERSPTGALRLRALIPQGIPPELMILILSRAASVCHYHLTDCLATQKNQRYTIIFSPVAPDPGKEPTGTDRRPVVELSLGYTELFYSATARMAILIDEFGFKADQTTIDFLSYSEPLTVAIVPAQEVADWNSRIADQYHKEVLIQLPLESKQFKASQRSKWLIMVHYPERQIVGQITDAAKLFPRFAGYCNRGGSRALEDSRLCRILLSEIKKQDRFFIDIRTTRNSLAPAIADSIRVPCMSIEGAIPGETSEAKADSLLCSYTRLAQRSGQVLIKAACTGSFMNVLKNRQTWLRNNGIQLVYVSDLIKTPQSQWQWKDLNIVKK